MKRSCLSSPASPDGLLSRPGTDKGAARGSRIVADGGQLGRLQRDLCQAQKLADTGRLVACVAHDFNTVVTIIGSYAELLLDETGGNDPRRTDISRIQNVVARGQRLARQLLAFSRNRDPQPTLVSLNALVAGMDEVIRCLAAKSIELRLVLAPDLGLVKADPSQLEQVILNLVTNACDAMPCGGRMTIETMNVHLDADYARQRPGVRPGPYVLCATTDTGSGMDAETQARISEFSFTTKEHNYGVGLATVCRIVEERGGHITVSSAPGQGTAFRVLLPRSDELCAAGS